MQQQQKNNTGYNSSPNEAIAKNPNPRANENIRIRTKPPEQEPGTESADVEDEVGTEITDGEDA